MAGKKERRRLREKQARLAEQKPKQTKTPRQRLFTNEFALGDKVSVIRAEHGWHDGAVEGKIITISPNFAEVQDDNGYTYEINHPRDIRKLGS